jgi:hypothetical protein
MKPCFFFGDLLVKKSINLLKILVSINNNRIVRIRTLGKIYIKR